MEDIWKTRKKTFIKDDILKINLNQKEKNPYWIEKSKSISQKLWLPEKLQYNNVAININENFTKNLKIYESRDFNDYNTIDYPIKENLEEIDITYCRKIRIYPSPEQISLFNKCTGANRYFYNQANNFVKTQYQLALENAKNERQRLIDLDNGCIVILKTGKNKGNQCCKPKYDNTNLCKLHKDNNEMSIDYSYLKRIVIRDNVVPADKDLTSETIWQKDVPYYTRQLAIDQLLAVYKSNFALRKNRDNKDFNISYKSKKQNREIFQIEKRTINFSTMKIFPRRLKKKLRVRKRDIKKLQEATSGIITCLKIKPGKWYLCIPRKKKLPQQPIYENAHYKSVFLDPGVRTFMTFYSPDGVSGKIGDDYSNSYIKSLTDKIDRLESVRSRTRNWKTRRNIRNRLFKLRNKSKNIIGDLHWKTCKFLCNGFDNIYLPQFKTKEMALKNKKRVISNKTVRTMLNLSHYEFQTRLIYYAKTKRRDVHIIGEEYTTKTCGSCGKINDIGGEKIYSCSCGYRLDRDLHGSRNICIKLLT